MLRVNRKYIDHCLEEIERLWRQRGIVGFSENGRRLDTDICNIRATALWDPDGYMRCLPAEIQPDMPEPTVRLMRRARLYRLTRMANVYLRGCQAIERLDEA